MCSARWTPAPRPPTGCRATNSHAAGTPCPFRVFALAFRVAAIAAARPRPERPEQNARSLYLAATGISGGGGRGGQHRRGGAAGERFAALDLGGRLASGGGTGRPAFRPPPRAGADAHAGRAQAAGTRPHGAARGRGPARPRARAFGLDPLAAGDRLHDDLRPCRPARAAAQLCRRIPRGPHLAGRGRPGRTDQPAAAGPDRPGADL